MRRLVTALLMLACSSLAWAEVEIQGVRMWPAPDSTRLVFDVSAPVSHKIFTLANPDRIVIDLRNASLTASLEELDYSGSLLKRVRTGARDGGDLRVVLDLKERAQPKSFVLRPNQEYGHRLVIDLEDAQMRTQKPARTLGAGERHALREIIVAIDAGHGGEDPGAIGPTGTREKDVVLAIARRLQKMVAAEPGMRPVMVRDGDYYVSLSGRIQKAREQRADMFISIHADAFRNRRARGASVYTLSQRGASSEYARLLADKENSSDLVGGVSLDDKDDLLASVLLDLSQTAAIEASNEAASQVLEKLGAITHLHKRGVEQAGFRVLKAPDVPSLLVETAFISNPKEERKLRSSAHQYAVAKAIMGGIRNFFEHNPPPGTLIAARRDRRHVIASGETLSGIARQYRVNVENLRQVNDLQTDMVRVGEVLRIPPG